MGLAINLILIGISFIALAIAGGFATDAARRVGNLSQEGTNDKLKSSHKYLTIASVLCWILVALLLVGFFFAIFFAPEAAAATEEGELTAPKETSSFGNIISYLLLFIILAGVIAVGILSAIAAYDIRTSGVSDNNLSYNHAVIAASIAIGVFVLVLIALIVKFTYKPKPKKVDESSAFAEQIGEKSSIPEWANDEEVSKFLNRNTYLGSF